MAFGFLRKLFASAELETVTPPEPVEPLELAKRLAGKLPGAVLEDLSRQPLSTAFARLSFVHGEAPFRLTFVKFDATTCNVWLETRALGKYGHFGLMRWDPHDVAAEENARREADEYEAPPPRLFLTKHCYFESERARVEAARFLSLPHRARLDALKLCADYQAMVLEDQVLGLHCCGLARFSELCETEVALPLRLAERLAQIARALPQQPRHHAHLAEARTCRYCATPYIFSPQSPQCARCGAAPEADGTTAVRPPGPPRERPDTETEERRRAMFESRLASIRPLVQRLLQAVPSAQVREEPEQSQIVVSWVDGGTAVSAIVGWTEVALTVAVPGAQGHFFLGHFDDEEADNESEETRDPWREIERPLFVSRHCRFQSEHTSAEAARFCTLPDRHRAWAIELCEATDGWFELNEEELRIEAGTPDDYEAVAPLLARVEGLRAAASELPRDWRPEQAIAVDTHSCSHCRCVVFLPVGTSACSHCGAAA